jgi:ABC-type glutathione transport system ATPase component
MSELTGVTKLYQKSRRTVPAVAGLDLTIEDGEWLAVQGRTGHGKSTLLNLLGGLDRRAHHTAGGEDRVHLPDLQPDPHPVSGRERRDRADTARDKPRGPADPDVTPGTRPQRARRG